MDLFSLSYMEIDFVLFNGYALSLEYVIVYIIIPKWIGICYFHLSLESAGINTLI